MFKATCMFNFTKKFRQYMYIYLNRSKYVYECSRCYVNGKQIF